MTPRGLTTSLVPDGDGGIEIIFDLIDHRVGGHCGSGASRSFALAPMSVADFHAQFVDMVTALGGDATFHGRPNELQDFRTGFRGKVSPVHLFWGSFDLAVTRFSGRRAPLHPEGFDQAAVQPGSASFNTEFGEFILPYEAVRNSADPEATLMAFLESTYAAAAKLGNWDRSLECRRGLKGQPHPIDDQH